MKNKVSLLLGISLILFVTIGCSLGGLTGSDKEKSKDVTVEKSESSDSSSNDSSSSSNEEIKIGIPECDEMATYINDNSEEIEGSLVARGIVYVYKNLILSNIKEGVEKMDEKEKQKLGEACAKSLKQLKEQVKK